MTESPVARMWFYENIPYVVCCDGCAINGGRYRFFSDPEDVEEHLEDHRYRKHTIDPSCQEALTKLRQYKVITAMRREML